MTAWWTNLALRSKGLIVIAIPCAILLGVIVAVYAVDVAERRADAVVAHSTQVRTGIERTLALMDRAETSVRSFLIVPRREFLADYATVRQQVLDALEELAGLLARDEAQIARLESVESLVVDRLKALDIVGRIPDPDGRFRERSVRTGQAVLESLRGTLGLMQQDAEQVLAAQTAAAERQAALMGWLLLLSGATGVGGGVFAAILFTAGLGDRMRRLGDAARDISHGAYDTRLPAAADEIGVLAERLREAAIRLDEREQQLRSARDEADMANRAKGEFLSRMSHGLRTPLHAILGFGQSLQVGRLDATGVESVDQIMRSGRHLLRLINEVLEVSRIDAGTLSLSPESVHAADVVREAVSTVLPLAARNGVALLVHDGDFAGIYVRADRQCLTQVLVNLLSNAVRGNRQNGRVDVTSATGHQVFRIAVHDTGAGIPPADLDRAFEPFECLAGGSIRVETTGLELYIARGLAIAMGGAMRVESQAEQGSVFSVELPLAARPGAAPTDLTERAS